MNFETVIAKYRLGLLASGELPEIATQALASGKDSPALRQLAGADADDMGEVRRLFERTLHELGLAVPSQDEAGKVVTKSIARDVLNGSEQPYDGAKKMWRLYVQNPSLHELKPFVGLASEYEDDPQNRDGYLREIRKACQSLVEG